MSSNALALSLLLLFGGASAASAAPRQQASQSDQDACEPDVHRLCDQYIPDETQIVACLKSEKKHLSPGCARVMARP